jgi:CheY-like chemotaxis protein
MPTTKPLSDRRILVVEDETLIAMVMVDFLRDQGAWVIGPVSTVDSAMDAIASSSKIDGAFLDINLNGEASYFVADLLSERGIPFIFVTGYRENDIPARYKAIKRCEKPKGPEACVQILRSLWPPG